MRLSFIFPPYAHKLFEENIRVVDEEFGVFPPINLGYAASVARAAGHDVQLIDANALGLSVAQTVERLRRFRAEAAGFYLSTYMIRETLSWARAVRESLRVPVLAGGVCTALYPAEVMANTEVDVAVEGEAVRSLPVLLAALEAGRSLDGLPGVWSRSGGEVRFTAPLPDPVPFDDYPFPLRDQLPNDRYHSITSQRKNFTILLTQIGCPYRCAFCPIPLSRYRARSAESVLCEVEECYREYGVREIDFFDAEFPVNAKRVTALCEGFGNYPGLEWSCRSRLDSVDGDLMRLMHGSGCRKIYFGIESADQSVLDLLCKDIDVSRVLDVIRTCAGIGIRPLGFFMAGVPGETRESFRRTVRLAQRLPLSYVQYSRMIAKPRTKLDEELVAATGYDYWRAYVRGEAEEKRLPNIWSRVPEEELERMTKMAYYRFYFRPRFILRALGRVKSLGEVLRGARVAARMLLDYLKPELRKSPL